jgi:hypothetical protein
MALMKARVESPKSGVKSSSLVLVGNFAHHAGPDTVAIFFAFFQPGEG